MNSIVLCGGGTAGHILPNIALEPYLKRHFDKIIYIGSHNGLEKKIANKNNIEYHSTDVIKLNRRKIISNLRIPFVLIKGIIQAKSILKEHKPSVVFCKGGYASIPTAYAAKHLKIPVICHESDMTLGLANRLISRFAVATFTSFDKTIGKGNIIHTGIPIRDNIDRGDKNRIIRQLDLHLRPTILVMGGSMGAKAINECIIEALPYLTKTFNVLHISGTDDINISNEFYRNIKYTNNIEDYYALADIVISRAGATACTELSYLNKKTILIPLPKGTSRGDQVQNAVEFEREGLVKVLYQDKLSKETLISTIKDLYNATSPLYNINKASNVEIAKLISEYCR